MLVGVKLPGIDIVYGVEDEMLDVKVIIASVGVVF
jgi:hypothetical protein